MEGQKIEEKEGGGLIVNARRSCAITSRCVSCIKKKGGKKEDATLDQAGDRLTKTIYIRPRSFYF